MKELIGICRKGLILLMIMTMVFSMSSFAFADEAGTEVTEESNVIDSGFVINEALTKSFTWEVTKGSMYTDPAEDEEGETEEDQIGYTLTIEGEGPMPDFPGDYELPWSPYSKYIRDVVVGEGITRVGNYSFHDLESLDYIDISHDVEAVGAHAFETKDGSPAEIKFSDKIKAIEASAFASLELADYEPLVIPDGVETIGAKAFYNASGTTRIVLPKSLKSIGATMIYRIDFIDSVRYKGTKKQLAKIKVTKKGNLEMLDEEVKCSDGRTYFANNLESAKVTIKDCVYNGKKRTPKVIVKDTAGNTLKKGRDYTVKYYGKRVRYGEYKVRITPVKSGNYMGDYRDEYFCVIPKTPIITGKGRDGEGYSYVMWKAPDRKKLYGIEVQWSTTKDFKKKHSTTYYNSVFFSCQTKGMKKGKAYYFRVRAVADWDGSAIYSKWSKVVRK